MRLIDADAANVNDIPCSYGGNCDIDNVQMWLDEQPTVCVMNAEPVRHGEWIKAHGMLPPEFFGKHKCSLCGHFALSWRIGHEELSNYCPNCGAKMDGGKQDANV